MSRQNRRAKRRRPFLFVLNSLALLLVVGTLLGFQVLKRSGWGIGISDLLSQSLPKNDPTVADPPEQFLIEAPNWFEQQGTNQCGGFSVAYLLRFYGEESTGSEVYERMGHQLDNGYLLPQGISDELAQAGHPTAFYRSEIDQLKTHVAAGTPVIVLIGQGFGWQHYVTVVGYDNENFYLFDSLKQTVYDNPHYNRAIDAASFTQYWNNGLPLFERICFVVPSK